MPYKLSPSKLNMLMDCPRCFWRAMVQKVEFPGGPMAGIVMKIDSIIKHYFNKYREKNQLPPIIKGQVKGRLAKNMPKTLNYEESKDIIITGRPDDYLEIEDGKIVAFDHKTKSSPPEEVHEAHQLQMDIYSYLLIKNGYPTANKAYLAYYYPNECDIHDGLDMGCKVVEVKTSPERAKRIINQAIKVLEMKTAPKAGKECEVCGFVGRR